MVTDAEKKKATRQERILRDLGRGTAVSGIKNSLSNFSLRVTPGKSSVVQVFDKAVKGKKAVMRFDNPHLNTKVPVTTPHINTRGAMRKVIPDHAPISGAQLKGAEFSAKAVNVVNKVAKPLAFIGMAIDAYRIGSSAKDDYEKGSTRNTTNTMAQVAGGWGGGYGGAVSGAAIGSAFLPGLGTLAGAIIGGISGGIGGSIAAEKIVETVSDTVGYDVEWIVCEWCEEQFECRIYETGRIALCSECTSILVLLTCVECDGNYILGDNFILKMCSCEAAHDQNETPVQIGHRSNESIEFDRKNSELSAELCKKIAEDAAREAKIEVEREKQKELNMLKEKLEQLELETSCAICMDSKIAIVFNCGHTACVECSDKLNKVCHICRKTIETTQFI